MPIVNVRIADDGKSVVGSYDFTDCNQTVVIALELECVSGGFREVLATSFATHRRKSDGDVFMYTERRDGVTIATIYYTQVVTLENDAVVRLHLMRPVDALVPAKYGAIDEMQFQIAGTTKRGHVHFAKLDVPISFDKRRGVQCRVCGMEAGKEDERAFWTHLLKDSEYINRWDGSCFLFE